MSTFSGIPIQPSDGSKRTRYPDVRFQADFYTQPPIRRVISAVATADSSGVGRSTSDIIGASVFKSIANPAGTWSVTLVPRQDYLTQISPGDWCLISGDNGDGLGMRRICYGPVKQLRRTINVTDKGVTRMLVQVNGTDFGGTLVKTSGIFDAQLGGEEAVISLNLGALTKRLGASTGSSGVIIKALLQYYLGIQGSALAGGYLPQLYDPQTGLPFAASLDLSYIDPDTLGAVAAQGVNPATSLWQSLQQFANLGLNELFVDDRPADFTTVVESSNTNLTNLVPALVLRQCPFWGKAWQGLPTVTVESDEVGDMDLSTGDVDVKNWIRPMDETNTKQFLNTKIGTINPRSIGRFGFCRYENPTQFVFPSAADVRLGNQADIASILRATASLQTLWNHSNENLLSGSMTLCLHPEIRVGYRLLYKDRDTATQLEFYVEEVHHTFSYPGPSTTTVTVTRGRDVSDPLWYANLGGLMSQGIIVEIANTVSQTMAAGVRGVAS
jgi:hypothetical protein